MRRYLIVTSLLCSLALLSACPPPQIRVGLVDGTRMVKETQHGRKMRDSIAAEGDRLTRELEARQKQVAALEAEAKKAAQEHPKGGPEVERKSQAHMRAQQELRETHLRYRKQLNEYGQRLLDEFKRTVRRVALHVKRSRGLDLVVMTSRGEQQGIWIWPVTDITDLVLKLMDDEQGAPPPRQ